MPFVFPGHTLPKRMKRFIGLLFLCFTVLTGLALNSYHDSLLRDKMDHTRRMVENAYNLIAYYHGKAEKKELTEENAQLYAQEAIRQLVPEQNSYYWVMDTHPRMLMHPIKPEMNGADLTDYVGPDGQKLFQEMVQITKGPSAAGFIQYQWNKPGDASGELYPKISYIKFFRPWQWIVGTGVYIDDVADIFWTAVSIAGGLSLAILLFVMALAMTVSEVVRRP